jgi:hypothetical protein
MTRAFITFAALLLACLTAMQAGPPDLSTNAASREANTDIRSGQVKIYVAGTEAPLEQDVRPRDRALVRNLRRDYSLPMGCTDPAARDAVEYATVYNRAIIAHLRGAKSQ